MFCKYCGKELIDGAKFCSQCGKMLTPRATNTASQEEQAEAKETTATVAENKKFCKLKDDGYLKEKHFVTELPVKQAPFIMEHCFYSKV